MSPAIVCNSVFEMLDKVVEMDTGESVLVYMLVYMLVYVCICVYVSVYVSLYSLYSIYSVYVYIVVMSPSIVCNSVLEMLDKVVEMDTGGFYCFSSGNREGFIDFILS
jgi:hypothetical protein